MWQIQLHSLQSFLLGTTQRGQSYSYRSLFFGFPVDDFFLQILRSLRRSDPFYIVTCFIKWVTTSWTHSTMWSKFEGLSRTPGRGPVDPVNCQRDPLTYCISPLGRGLVPINNNEENNTIILPFFHHSALPFTLEG